MLVGSFPIVRIQLFNMVLFDHSNAQLLYLNGCCIENSLTLKVLITTAADDILKYFCIIFRSNKVKAWHFIVCPIVCPVHHSHEIPKYKWRYPGSHNHEIQPSRDTRVVVSFWRKNEHVLIRVYTVCIKYRNIYKTW